MITLDLQSRAPIYEQLKNRISEMLALGLLEEDEQLPSVRSLARELGISPNTVQKAYQELERDGVLYSVTGKGSFVKSGESAAGRLRGEAKEQIRQALAQGKSVGITRAEATDLVRETWEDET